jgi:exopolysaccharide biosynthesis polyprenyl glycosylphosphotransferase
VATLVPTAAPVEVTEEAARPRLPRPVVKAALVAADGVALAAAMVVAFRLRVLLPGNSPESAGSQHALVGAIALPAWLAVFARYRLYAARFIDTRLVELSRVVHAVGAGVALMALTGFMLQWYVARGWLALTFAVGVVAVVAEREAVRRAFVWARRRGHFVRPAVIVGANAEGLAIYRTLLADPALGYRIEGVVADDAPPELNGHHLGGLDGVVEAVRRRGANTVIVATTAVDAERVNRLVRDLTEAGVHVELSSSLRDIAAGRLTVRPLGRFPVVYVEPVARRGWRQAAKRTFDVVGAVVAGVVSLPLVAVVALAIRLDSPGPVLFRQRRVGRGGRPFELVKFRTMVQDAEERLAELTDRNEADGPLFKIRDDPRVTRVGRVLRRLSLDELPQLWNVLRGEMSLVGPRPALPSEVAAWSEELHARLRVRPGITGMWQVGGRSEASFDEYVRLDLYYVDNWSLWIDLAILAKTIPAVLARRGAY